jgi:RNA recognition motif-containing protein
MNIYVGNLNYKVNEDELKSLFESYGTVDKIRIINDRETGRSRGFAFVTMNDDQQAEEAIKELNGAEMNGRTLKVNQAFEKNDQDRPRRKRISREEEY